MKGLLNDLIPETGQKCMSRTNLPGTLGFSIILPSSTSVQTLFQILHNNLRDLHRMPL